MANYTDDKTYNKEMWLIIRTTRQNIQDNNKEMWLIVLTTRQQDIQQRDVANYTDDKTNYTDDDDIQQRDVANYTDDKTYNKEMWLTIRTTRHTTKRCG